MLGKKSQTHLSLLTPLTIRGNYCVRKVNYVVVVGARLSPARPAHRLRPRSGRGGVMKVAGLPRRASERRHRWQRPLRKISFLIKTDRTGVLKIKDTGIGREAREDADLITE